MYTFLTKSSFLHPFPSSFLHPFPSSFLHPFPSSCTRHSGACRNPVNNESPQATQYHTGNRVKPGMATKATAPEWKPGQARYGDKGHRTGMDTGSSPVWRQRPPHRNGNRVKPGMATKATAPEWKPGQARWRQRPPHRNGNRVNMATKAAPEWIPGQARYGGIGHRTGMDTGSSPVWRQRPPHRNGYRVKPGMATKATASEWKPGQARYDDKGRRAIINAFDASWMTFRTIPCINQAKENHVKQQ